MSKKDDMSASDKEGITMTSMLFCSHGGLITPVSSGQILFFEIVGVSRKLESLLKKYETGMDKNGNYLPEGDPALYPYHSPSDAPNVLTIGWGHAMASFNEGWFLFKDGTNINLYNMCTYDKSQKNVIGKVANITEAQAEEILDYDLKIREEELNEVFKTKKIGDMINQQFYDALFLLTYQMGTKYLTDGGDLSTFLEKTNFDLNNEKEIKEQFGEFTNHLQAGTMMRRADELDIILKNEYGRDYDETRYGDIWRKKTFPNMTTPGY